jgi:hypothetical protein
MDARFVVIPAGVNMQIPGVQELVWMHGPFVFQKMNWNLWKTPTLQLMALRCAFYALTRLERATYVTLEGLDRGWDLNEGKTLEDKLEAEIKWVQQMFFNTPFYNMAVPPPKWNVTEEEELQYEAKLEALPEPTKLRQLTYKADIPFWTGVRKYALMLLGDTCKTVPVKSKLVNLRKYLLEELYHQDMQKYKESSKWNVILMLDENKAYMGHIYVHIRQSLCDMIGIRASLLNIFLRLCSQGVSQVAPKMISAVTMLCSEKKGNRIHVKQALDPMPALLMTCGFREQVVPGQRSKDHEALLSEIDKKCKEKLRWMSLLPYAE